jgi:hypothetical protein
MYSRNAPDPPHQVQRRIRWYYILDRISRPQTVNATIAVTNPAAILSASAGQKSSDGGSASPTAPVTLFPSKRQITNATQSRVPHAENGFGPSPIFYLLIPE